VSLKLWSKVECQKFLPVGLLKEHVKFNLNISDFVGTDNFLVLQTERMFLEKGVTLPGCADKDQAVARWCQLQLCAGVRELRHQVF
jgi:hypothetical protein